MVTKYAFCLLCLLFVRSTDAESLSSKIDKMWLEGFFQILSAYCLVFYSLYLFQGVFRKMTADLPVIMASTL